MDVRKAPGELRWAAAAAVVLLGAAPLSAWTDVVVDGGPGAFASLELVSGRPAIAYRVSGVLRYVRAADARGLSWGAPVVVDATAYGRGVDLAIVDGNPAIVYYHTTGPALMFVRATDPDGVAWGSPLAAAVAVVDAFAASPSLAVIAGNPAVGYVDGHRSSYVRALDPDGVSWGAPIVVGSPTDWDNDASLAVVNGRPAILHTINGACMYYVRADDATGTSWQAPHVCAVYIPFTDAEAALTIVAGNPASVGRSFYTYPTFTRALDPDGTNWPPGKPETGYVPTQNETALAIVGGWPAIAFQAQTRELLFQRATDAAGATWGQVELVDAAGDVGRDVSLLGLTDGAGAAYFDDGAGGALKYAFDCLLDIAPGALPAGTVGSAYVQALTATGGTAPYVFALDGGTLPPGISLSTTGVLSGTPTLAGRFFFRLLVTDATGCPHTQSFELKVCPASCPTITLAPPVLPDAQVGAGYSENVTATGGLEPYVYALTAGSLPPGLVLQSIGRIVGNPTSAGTYTFTATATDDCGCTGSQVYTIDVCPSCTSITITPPTLPAAVEGSPYSQQLSASGGSAPYSWQLHPGDQLPPGMNLSGTGLISGTPTTPGNYLFSIEARDACGCLGSQDYTLVVACAAISISPSSLPGGTQGAAYSVQLSASGGAAPYAFTSSQLPAGLALSSGGLLSGTPSTSGSFPVDVTATDALGCSGTRAYVLQIGAAASANVLAGQGLGGPNPNRVRLFDATGAPTGVDFLAYAAGQWGVNVFAADVDGPWHAEILAGPGPGSVFGPQVRGFFHAGTPIAKVSYFAYGTLRYGVNVAAGRLDGDAFAEILSGAGPGNVFGPHVRGWNYDGLAVAPIGNVSFFAYGTLQLGVNVGSGDVDGDGFGEVLTGPGPGPAFGPTVRGFNVDGGPATAIAKINFDAYGLRFGVNVAGGDVEDDGYGEIATAPGPGPANPSWFKGFDVDGVSIAPIPGFDATPFATSYGGRVGLGDLDVDGADDLIGGAGREASATSDVVVLSYTGGALVPLVAPFEAFPSSGYGVNATVGLLAP